MHIVRKTTTTTTIEYTFEITPDVLNDIQVEAMKMGCPCQLIGKLTEQWLIDCFAGMAPDGSHILVQLPGQPESLMFGEIVYDIVEKHLVDAPNITMVESPPSKYQDSFSY